MQTIIGFLGLTVFLELLMNAPEWLLGKPFRTLFRLAGPILWVYVFVASAKGIYDPAPNDPEITIFIFGLCWSGFMLFILRRVLVGDSALANGPIGVVAYARRRSKARQ